MISLSVVGPHRAGYCRPYSVDSGCLRTTLDCAGGAGDVDDPGCGGGYDGADDGGHFLGADTVWRAWISWCEGQHDAR